MGFALLELIDKSHLAGLALIWRRNIMPAEEAGEMHTYIALSYRLEVSFA